MIRRKRSCRLFVWGSLVLTTLAGCEERSSSSPRPSSPLPTEIVSIFVGGQCRVAANTIVCRDASRSEPEGRLAAVDWELISSSSGISQGGLPSPPRGEIAFTGLAPGTYQVDQSVYAQDGSSQERTYGPLVVSPTMTTGALRFPRPGHPRDFARPDVPDHETSR
jgi:hypothetical protein